MELLWFAVPMTSLWMGFEAKSFGYDKHDVRGLASLGPVGWFLAGLTIWVVALPLYLASRETLRRAGESRRARADDDRRTADAAHEALKRSFAR